MKHKTEILAKCLINLYYFGNKNLNNKLKYNLYKIINFMFAKMLLNSEIPATVKIGENLKIYHPYGITINEDVEIGKNAILRKNVTIGNKGENNQSVPVIGNNVEFGVGSVVIGPVSIGDNSIVGANAVVTKSCEKNSVMVGMPAVNIFVDHGKQQEIKK